MVKKNSNTCLFVLSRDTQTYSQRYAVQNSTHPRVVPRVGSNNNVISTPSAHHAKDASVSEYTWTLSALEALRNALYKFKTYLLPYLLTTLFMSQLESRGKMASVYGL